MKLTNTLLITGASSGVGLSLVHHLKDRFKVIAVARRIGSMREAFAAYPNVYPYELDLSVDSEVAGVLEDMQLEHGSIPYLINNAGLNVAAPVSELETGDLYRSLMVNAVAPLVIMQSLLPSMRAQNFGRVINVTSGAPFNCFPGYAAYSASKAALNALTVTAAKEVADYDIKINLMSPGPVRSEMAPNAALEPSVCHPTVDYLLALDKDGPTGRFFWLDYEVPLFPDHSGISWLEGRADEHFRRKG